MLSELHRNTSPEDSRCRCYLRLIHACPAPIGSRCQEGEPGLGLLPGTEGLLTNDRDE